jgi:hypothetical protein
VISLQTVSMLGTTLRSLVSVKLIMLMVDYDSVAQIDAKN